MRIGWTVEASGDVANLSNDEQQDPDQDKLDGLSNVNAEPGFAEGDVIACLFEAANADELATEPLGYDDNDMDDFNTGTTGPTITQTDINPDNSFSGSLHVAMNPADAERMCREEMRTHGCSDWNFAWNTRATALGLTNFRTRTIYLSKSLTEVNTEAQMRDTILHEIAHALVGVEAGHGPIWQAKARELGANPNARAGEDAVALPAKVVGVCPNCNTEYGRQRMPRDTNKWGCPERGCVIDAQGDFNKRRLEWRRASAHLGQWTGSHTASWTDVQSKAQRIYKEGGIRIISVTGPYVTAHVRGDDGTYETTLQRGKSGSIDQWTCSCPWFAYSFGRSGRWKKYEGRMCSHALALQYQAQSEGMFGRDIKEQPQSPGWDNEITHYEAPPPKEWRASVDPTPATRVASRLFLGEEARDEDGKWTSGMGEVTPKGYGKITPGEARGDSKKVTPQEFDDLAEKGKQKYDSLLADKRPTTAFDDADKWATIRSGAYDAAQKKWGGQTLDPATGRAVERSKGFSLEVRAPGEKQLSVPQDADEDTFNAMMDRAKEEYADKLKGAEVYLGVFRDDDNNRIDFDPVTIVDTPEEVDALGAYTHAVGGAYDFSTGNGHFPPHVASLASDVKESVLMWSTIKVNNQKALPNPEHDGFRYGFHQILGDVGAFRYNASDPLFLKGEHLAATFLKAFMDNQVPSHRPLYRAIGLHPDDYMTILTSCQSGSIDLPPASWSANKALTEQFGLDYAQGTKFYEERIIFVTRPGSSSWALGRASNTGYEREHIVGGRFHVVSIKFPPETDNTTVITLQESETWPEDFSTTGDFIEHMAFDSAIASPQDTGKTAKGPSCEQCGRRIEYRGYDWRHLTTVAGIEADMDHKAIKSGTSDHWEWLKKQSATDPHKGTMIAVRPPDSLCGALALDTPDAESYEQLHVTLAYIGPDESDELDLDTLREIVESQARLSPYISATLAGHGTFENPEGDVSVVLVDSEELQVARALLVSALERAGIEISHLHGFTPHITLTYGDPGELETVDSQPFLFTEFIISPPSGEWEHYPLNHDLPHTAAMKQVSPEYTQTGKPSEEDVQNLIDNYVEMHGERPSDKQIEKLRSHMGFVTADQENPIPPTQNAEPSWGATPISQDDPSGSPMDSDGGVDTVLPGAQATLDDEPEGALPSTDGDAGADGAQSDQDYYPTDEQINSKPYGGEGAAPSTIAWLDPSISHEEVKGTDDMDIAAAARNYLMTSTAVKSFTYAEQQEIINEGEGVTASNLDRLNLDGTHYEQLEEQIARAEATGEPIIWW